jgi:hypothetical protein
MLKTLPTYSPFYAAYAPQAEAVNAAVAQAAKESAAQMGAQFAHVYNLSAYAVQEKLAA